MVHKYLQPGKSLNTQCSQFMILPAFMIFLAGEYSNSDYTASERRLPYSCSVPDMDFCILLSNALDNAMQGDFILLEIKNSMEGCSPGRTDGPPVYQDEYISRKGAEDKPSGLYHLGQDENDRPKVFYDAPAKANASGREIENLRKKAALLKQQLSAASKDEEKTEELKKKLAAVQEELNRKDTDSYRRQDASISSVE